MKLLESWIKVTLLSKILAIILFASLPFIGFYLGVRYQKLVNIITEQKPTNLTSLTPTVTPIPSTTVINWKTYQSKQHAISFQIPENFIIEETNNYANSDKDFWGIYITDPNKYVPGFDNTPPSVFASLTLDNNMPCDDYCVYRDEITVEDNTFVPFGEGLLVNQYIYGNYHILSHDNEVNEEDQTFRQFLSSLSME